MIDFAVGQFAVGLSLNQPAEVVVVGCSARPKLRSPFPSQPKSWRWREQPLRAVDALAEVVVVADRELGFTVWGAGVLGAEGLQFFGLLWHYGRCSLQSCCKRNRQRIRRHD